MKKILSILFQWNVPIATEEKLEDADVILTHDFGDQKLVNESVRCIVGIGVQYAKRYNMPMICQWPGNQVAYKQGIVPLHIIRRNELHAGKYLDTEEVHRQVAYMCKREGWKKVILCVHPDHAWRAGENLKHHGLIPLFPDLSSVPYDPCCLRKSMSNKRNFRFRERFVRIHYLLRGYLNY